MLFYILGIISIILAVGVLLFFILGEFECGMSSIFIFLACMFPVSVTWNNYASHVSNINNQHLVIEQYQERIESLNTRLQNFDYPKSALMNADTPVAAIVNSLSDAEERLLEAKTSRINSIKKAEATRLGPMSGVINFVGDYKLQEEK